MWLGHHFQGQKVKGQLAGGGGILWRPPAQLDFVLCFGWLNFVLRGCISLLTTAFDYFWFSMLSFYSKIINLNSHLFDKLLENAAQRRRTLNSPGIYCDRRNVSPLGAKTRKKSPASRVIAIPAGGAWHILPVLPLSVTRTEVPRSREVAQRFYRSRGKSQWRSRCNRDLTH